MNLMSSKNKKRTFIAMIGALTVVIMTLYFWGLRVNLDKSVSAIFWRTSNQQVKRNSYVIICFPAVFVDKHHLARHFPGGGRCGGIRPLLKKVIAIDNDSILINSDGIIVNGKMIHGSKPLPNIPRLATKQIMVPRNMIAVSGQTKDSLDSRYFGLINKKWIDSSATPLF